MADAESSQESTVQSTNVDVFDMNVGLVDDGDSNANQSSNEGGDQVDLSSLPPAEAQARQGGWLPKDEFVKNGGDAEDHVSAKVFNDRGEIFDSVKKTNKEVAYLKRQLVKRDKALRALGEHNQKLGEIEYKKALDKLKADKAEALRVGDYEGAVDIDEKLADVKKNEIKADDVDLGDDQGDVNAAAPPPQEWVDYEAENSHWYNKNQIMTSAANNLIMQYIQENGIDGVPTTDEINGAIAYMDTEIRDAFPHKFTEDNGNPTTKPAVKPRPRGSNKAVEVGSGSNTRTTKSTGTSKYGPGDLSEEQMSLAKTFVNSGALKTVQEYVDQLAEVGGIVKS